MFIHKAAGNKKSHQSTIKIDGTFCLFIA